MPIFSSLCVETDALCRLAFLCDGDARIALNGLETAMKAVMGGKTRLITMEDIKRGLERSYVQYDRAGEMRSNLKFSQKILNRHVLPNPWTSPVFFRRGALQLRVSLAEIHTRLEC